VETLSIVSSKKRLLPRVGVMIENDGMVKVLGALLNPGEMSFRGFPSFYSRALYSVKID
jgi:hypothetical protein